MNSNYKNFLINELEILKTKSLPLHHRSPFSKNDTLRYVLKSGLIDTDGLIAEFGVYKGRSLRAIAKRLPESTVYGFDSFDGFPEDGREDWKCDFSVQGRLPSVPRNVELVPGYFEDTLKEFAQSNKNSYMSFMHIDCDIYSSTKTIFNELSDLIKPGCVIVFDELLHYGGFENNEIKAFYEFLEATGLNFEWLAIRNKVMSLDDYFNVMHNDLDDYKKMSQWRRKGYEQEVAVMIT